MPLLCITVSETRADVDGEALLRSGSRLVAEHLGKPEEFIMVSWGRGPLLFGGSDAPAAFVELRSIGGLDLETNDGLARALCALLEEAAGIPPARTFLNFADVARSDWGWDGKTFAS